MLEDTMFSQLEKSEGSKKAAARAAAVTPERWNHWRKGRVTEDGLLRCFLAMHPQGRHLLIRFRGEMEDYKARQKAQAE